MNEKSMSTRTSYLQGLTLKELLEHPDLQNAPQTADDKESFQDEQNDPLAAFLGPNLWEKTYDFNLEYMNLDDFLTESGISTDAVTQLDSSSNDDNCCSFLPIPSPGSRPPNDLLNSTASSSESLHDLPAGLDLTPEKICSKVDFNVSKLDLVLATDTGIFIRHNLISYKGAACGGLLIVMSHVWKWLCGPSSTSCTQAVLHLVTSATSISRETYDKMVDLLILKTITFPKRN